jgi:hypothetical protein
LLGETVAINDPVFRAKATSIRSEIIQQQTGTTALLMGKDASTDHIELTVAKSLLDGTDITAKSAIDMRGPYRGTTS